MVPKSKLLEFQKLPLPEMQKRANQFCERMATRRSVRDFSSRDVPGEIVRECVRAALTAPSGANMQPWHFVIVSDPEVKKRIRDAAEETEREFYKDRAPDEWLDALEPLGTGPSKPFLETAPYLIVVFEQLYRVTPEGEKRKHYYTKESVGIATGILITALHNAGLAALTHTPNPMGFLNEILNRPENEKPFMLLVTGYPEENTEVPEITRKSFDEAVTIV